MPGRFDMTMLLFLLVWLLLIMVLSVPAGFVAMYIYYPEARKEFVERLRLSRPKLGRGIVGQEPDIIAEAVVEKAKEHQISINERSYKMFVKAIFDYSHTVEPTGLVEEIRLGYEPTNETFHLLTILSTDWMPNPDLMSDPLQPLSPEELMHRQLVQAETLVWRHYPSLRINFHLAPFHRFPGLSKEDMFKRLVPATVIDIGTAP